MTEAVMEAVVAGGGSAAGRGGVLVGVGVCGADGFEGMGSCSLYGRMSGTCSSEVRLGGRMLCRGWLCTDHDL